ncbi:FAD-dependent oxidoreductase [Paraburkholderia strydomiana]|uniref:FAD-dependent oxidoreductase n=1 Tax=Paraburkholderia strydomiana TaxID=1245417 RepID=UPI0038BC0F67
MSRIAIIGAGITGVTTAHALAQCGHHVTVFERHRYAAMETSFANGGQLSASNAEVWNSMATVLKGLRWMFTRDAPLLLNPVPTWHKYSWMGEFLRQIPHYRANTVETVRLAIAAREHLFSIAEQEGIDFDLERRSELQRIEPTLHGDFYGGFFTPSDSTGDIHKFTRGLADACARHGVQFHYDAEIMSIEQPAEGRFSLTAHLEGETQRFGFERIVVCAGVKSRDFAAMLGDHVNVYPVKGYSITVCLDDATSRQRAPWVSLLDDSAKIVTSRLGADRFRVAGTAEINGFNRDIRSARIAPLVDWTRRHFPEVSTARVIPWAGLRPMLPSMLPKVGRGKRRGVFYNTGHGHLGWTLSAATAQAVARAIE